MIGRKHIGKRPRTVAAMMDNVYTGPSDEFLRRRLPLGWLFGELSLSRIEIQTGMTDEGAFVALLSTRLQTTLESMAETLDSLRAPTFPVHDEPALGGEQ